MLHSLKGIHAWKCSGIKWSADVVKPTELHFTSVVRDAEKTASCVLTRCLSSAWLLRKTNTKMFRSRTSCPACSLDETSTNRL